MPLGKIRGQATEKRLGLDAHILHEPHIVLVAMIVIVRDVGVVAASDLARRMRVGVPDRRAAAVFASEERRTR
jgi:hypothetical protein